MGSGISILGWRTWPRGGFSREATAPEAPNPPEETRPVEETEPVEETDPFEPATRDGDSILGRESGGHDRPTMRHGRVRPGGPTMRHARVASVASVSPAPAPGRRGGSLLALWLALAVGLPIIAVSYRVAVAHPASQAYYHIFWLGTLVAILPAVLLVLSTRVDHLTRQVALVAIAVVLTAPVVLLRLGGPYYHDEFPHVREVQAILETGRLLQPVSIVPIASSFPGLHSLSAALALVSGADAWVAGVVVVLTAHVLSLLGIYVLGRQSSGSDRVGAIAALVYALNPSYLFFDSQFAYESLAVCLFVWVVVFAAGMSGSMPRRDALIAAVGAFACVVTHHLTTLALLVVMILLAGARSAARRRRVPKGVATATWALTAATAGFAAFWVLVVARQTITYLGPYPQLALQELVNIASKSGSSRTLYAGTTAPAYERLAAFGTPVLLALAAAGAWVHAVARRTLTPTTTALYAFGMLYFVSVPLILTASGAEGARRSWAFSYLGLALLVAPWLTRILDRPRSAVSRRLVRIGVLAAVVVLLVGNVSAGLNVYYRFPGPVTYGVETRSTTAETLALARWLRRTAGPGARVVTDRITGLALGSTGAASLAVGSSGFPIWDLYTGTRPPSATLIEALRSSRYQYLVIDRRLAEVPIQGAYFDSAEPKWDKLPPFSAADLSKFDAWSWTPKVYESRNYSVYEFDFSQLGAPASTSSSTAAAGASPTPGATP